MWLCRKSSHGADGQISHWVNIIKPPWLRTVTSQCLSWWPQMLPGHKTPVYKYILSKKIKNKKMVCAVLPTFAGFGIRCAKSRPLMSIYRFFIFQCWQPCICYVFNFAEVSLSVVTGHGDRIGRTRARVSCARDCGFEPIVELTQWLIKLIAVAS